MSDKLRPVLINKGDISDRDAMDVINAKIILYSASTSKMSCSILNHLVQELRGCIFQQCLLLYGVPVNFNIDRDGEKSKKELIEEVEHLKGILRNPDLNKAIVCNGEQLKELNNSV